MIINLRKLDYILIIIIIILYLGTSFLESITGHTYMRYLSPVLILIFVVIYLQTLRSFENEFKRIKKLSNSQILESMIEVGSKIDRTISPDKKIINEIKYSQLNSKMAENILITLLQNKMEVKQDVKKIEDNIIKEFRSGIENNYFQIDALLSIREALDKAKYPMPQMRGWAICPDFGLQIISFVLKNKPAFAVDLGSGVSSLILGHIMKISGKGHIISLDHEEKYYRKTIDQVSAHCLSDIVEVYHKPLKDYNINRRNHLWYDIDNLKFDKPISMLIVDGPPASIQQYSRYPAVPQLIKYFDHECIILVDDYNRHEEKEMVNDWITQFGLEMIVEEKTEKGFCALRYLNTST